ncbi:sensor histidine kinase [Pseudomonas sp. CGJS7]|uniref:sensor histidine kinase n=1 Tax=Pseudomonas sp. CGJS7 TaxID=3109348 RepID=UPI00300BCCE1
MRASSSRRIALAYLGAWSLLGLAYLSAFPAYPGATLGGHLADAATNVAPGALLGVAVIAAAHRIAWMRPSPGWFVAIQAGFALAYSAAWMVAMAAVVTARGLDVAGYSTLILGSGPNRWQAIQGIVVYLVIAGLAYAYRGDRHSREQASRADRAEMLRSRAELAALRAQLNPHFIFNTLHSVHALVRRDPDAAQTAVERLGDLLRYALAAKTGAHDDVRLSQEWAFVLTYLELESLRLGERLRVDAKIAPEAEAAVIPAFTLQPLVENAIKHAIAPSVAGGTVRIRAGVEGDRLRLSVEDDGSGGAVVDSTGVGLSLVRRRLAERYAGDARLDAQARAVGFAVRADLPLVRSDRP